MNRVREIKAAIDAYATAYKRLEELQRISDCIPRGDQKTGAIGEFYAYLYLLRNAPQGSTIRFAPHSTKSWDIEILDTTGTPRKVSVKTVSDYSERRTMSPIHDEFDELLVILLDESFEPRGFWIVFRSQLNVVRWPLRSCRCPDPDKSSSGSTRIPFGENRVHELSTAIEAALDA